MAKSKYTVVRFYNTTKYNVIDKVFTATEYEQIGDNVDGWFDGKRLAKQAMKDYAGDCKIIDTVITCF